MDIDIFRHVEPHELRSEMDGAANDLCRYNAITHNFLFVINVMQEKVQGRDALAKPAFHLVPFGARNDARNQIEGEYPFCALLIVVDREGHALGEKGVVSDRPLSLKFFGRHTTETIEQPSVVRTDVAGSFEHLVKESLRHVSLKKIPHKPAKLTSRSRTRKEKSAAWDPFDVQPDRSIILKNDCIKHIPFPGNVGPFSVGDMEGESG